MDAAILIIIIVVGLELIMIYVPKFIKKYKENCELVNSGKWKEEDKKDEDNIEI